MQKKQKCKLKQICMFIVFMFVWNCFSCRYTVDILLVKVRTVWFDIIQMIWVVTDVYLCHEAILYIGFIHEWCLLLFLDQYFTFIFNSFLTIFLNLSLWKINSIYKGKMNTIPDVSLQLKCMWFGIYCKILKVAARRCTMYRNDSSAY